MIHDASCWLIFGQSGEQQADPPHLTDQLLAQAQALLAARGAEAPGTVLVAVDPLARSLEIVTGSRAARALDDRTCALASLTMTTSFAGGDLVGGLCRGLQVLADHGRVVAQRHLDTF